MEGKVAVVSLVVSDQVRSLEFFTEKLGFEKRNDVRPPGGTRWVSVGLKGQDLEIALFEAGAAVDPAQRERARNWAPGTVPPILLRVADCRTAFQELSARGVVFVQEPTEHPWGTVATFTDPDGNLFSMNQPPAQWPGR